LAALFISDLHLSPDRPEMVRLFQRFLAGPAHGADAVYILGDLFDYWLGDDALEDAGRADEFSAELLRDIGDCADSGVGFFFLHGNRDFLAGERFARAGSLQVIDDPTLLEIYGQRLLVSHGDALCTEDVKYQAFRARVRTPEWSREFLARPLAERRQQVEGLRTESEEEKRGKTAEIMDVNPAAVEALLRKHGYPTLVHGHTHRPARHVHVVDGHRCERWVLGDWYERGSCLVADARGLRSEVLV
jgi:UDP-2,3-diacylglucosamine hydrolase